MLNFNLKNQSGLLYFCINKMYYFKSKCSKCSNKNVENIKTDKLERFTKKHGGLFILSIRNNCECSITI